MRQESFISKLMNQRTAAQAAEEGTRRMQLPPDNGTERAFGGDFYSQAHHIDRQHQRRVEHNGANYWQYSYRGERPEDVIKDRAMPQHDYGTPQQRREMDDHMMSAESAMFEPELVHARWLDHVSRGKRNLEQGRLHEAESHFRMALDESICFNPRDPRLSRTYSLLAKVLCLQGKHDECEHLYGRALEIDEILLGKHSKELKEDFENLASHYIAMSQYGAAEKIYTAFIDRISAGAHNDLCVVTSLQKLAEIYQHQGKFEEAEAARRRSCELLRLPAE